uniref:Uncharacterized protein n=1 Tax=Desertifilum tharense IPPAS B-1220 TaxID=1781255 RepID=A0ACD5GSD8_9CYAN
MKQGLLSENWEEGSWGLGKKGVGSWELGVGEEEDGEMGRWGEEGSWELGVGGWGRRELGKKR